MRSLPIQPGYRVLEVGSGGSPYERSDILMDRYPEDATHREGAPIRMSERFVVGDAQYLPFKDGAFDYLICSHTLEHVDDPAAALREIERVSGRGYIETPNLLSEILFGWGFHKWIFSVRDGKLVWAGKGWRQNGLFGDYFHRLTMDNPEFRRFYYTHYHLFNIMYRWEGAINFGAQQQEISMDGGPLGGNMPDRNAERLPVMPDRDSLAFLKHIGELVTPPILMQLVKKLYRKLP